VLFYSLSLCVCTIISFLYDIDRRTLSAKKRRSTLCQQSINPISSPPFFLFVNAFAIVLTALRFIFSSISHHFIQHSSYSPSISFDTNRTKSVLIVYPTLSPTTSPIIHPHSYPYCMQIRICHFTLRSRPTSHPLPHFFQAFLAPVVVELTIPLCMYTRTIVACYIVILEGLSELLQIPFECMKIQLCRTNSVQSSGAFSHDMSARRDRSVLVRPSAATSTDMLIDIFRQDECINDQVVRSQILN
jgi:hypothetical protein